MTVESALVGVNIAQTALIGWFLRDFYDRLGLRLTSHDRYLARLNRARESHKVRLIKLSERDPDLHHLQEFNDD